jgi:hypothetical protein
MAPLRLLTTLIAAGAALPLIAVVAAAAAEPTASATPIRRQRWTASTSIVDLMAKAEPVILTDSPAKQWAAEHWSPAELRERLEILYNVRWSRT